MSSLAWIDFDETERDRARQIMALFQEQESRDELGLGSIRDSIADHLFPGTSTIQTRLRYMLFVPWIFRECEKREGEPSALAAEARAHEIQLAEALKSEGETFGIIGRDAGARLQRLPSSVYWAGLRAWGIRLYPGSPDSYFASLRGLRRRRQELRESEDAKANLSGTETWHPNLPEPPADLLSAARFRLTIEEAEFIIDRLVTMQRSALLTTLAQDRIAAECDYIWQHPNIADFPPAARLLVQHANIFSNVMHGAALLYNLELALLRAHEEWIARYQRGLQTWASELDWPTVMAWSLDDFWTTVEHPGHTIRAGTKAFVTNWLELTRDGAARIAGSPNARNLVVERERRLKMSQSRFLNVAARDRWRGASGAARLAFRWPQAKRHLMDLANAE